jgi:predicted nucleotidyltransferase
MTQEETEVLIRTVVFKHVDRNSSYIFLFGSRAGRSSEPTSDYDVGIYGAKQVPLARVAAIRDELDQYPIPVDVDIVDFSSVAEPFRRLALKHIKLWNKPKNNWPLR